MVSVKDRKFKSLRTSVMLLSKGSLGPLSRWLPEGAQGRIRVRKEMYSSKYTSNSQHFINLMCGFLLFDSPKILVSSSFWYRFPVSLCKLFPSTIFFFKESCNRQNCCLLFFLSLVLAHFIVSLSFLSWKTQHTVNFYPVFQRPSLICWPLSYVTCSGCLFSRLTSLSLLSCPFNYIQGGCNTFPLLGILESIWHKILSLCVYIHIYICMYMK